VAKLLLENNAEVNVPSGSESNIPLTLACWKGMYLVSDSMYLFVVCDTYTTFISQIKGITLATFRM